MTRRDGPLAVCLFVLLLSVYLLTFSGTYHSSDEMSVLAATDSLARRGAWDTDLLRWQGEQQGSIGVDGHQYSRKWMGMTLAALPLYWVALRSPLLGNVQTALLTGGLLTALTGVLIYATLRRLKYGEDVSLGAALAYGLATMAWPYARYLFSETLAACGLMLAVYALASFAARTPTRGHTAPAAEGSERAVRSGLRQGTYSLLAGVGLGVALLARLDCALAVPFLAAWMGGLLLSDRRRSGRNGWSCLVPAILMGLPILAVLALGGWYNLHRFGGLLATPYQPEERWVTPFLTGLYGLTFSPGKGLFWYNPVFLAALAAWPAFFRRHRTLALVTGAVVLANLSFYAPWYLWWAGHSWGPRFQVTILPLVTLPLAPAIAAASRRRALALCLAAVGAASVAVQALGVAVPFSLYLEEIFAQLGLYHPATLFDPAYSPLVRQWSYLRPETLDVAWMREGVVNGWVLAVGLGLVVASLVALGRAWRGRWSGWAGAGLLLAAGLAAGGMLALLAPAGDGADAARLLQRMERPGEAIVLTDPLLTEKLQDAYDGRLPIWGGDAGELMDRTSGAVWTYGRGEGEPAEVRIQVGTVRLAAHLLPGQQFDRARLPLPAGSEWARLDGLADVAAAVGAHSRAPLRRAGEDLEVVVFWQALGPSVPSYTLFVQAVDAGGQKAGQIDRLPCGGGCPTSGWRAGDIVGERLLLPIRPDAAPGSYPLILGMYDLETGQRLPVRDAQGSDAGSYLPLGVLRIR